MRGLPRKLLVVGSGTVGRVTCGSSFWHGAFSIESVICWIW